jgi:hypothetical protein
MGFEAMKSKLTRQRWVVSRARRWGSRGDLVAATLAASLAFALPAAAQATPACAHLTNCTTVEASSWLAVPAGSATGPRTAGVVELCPEAQDSHDFAFAIGSDYQLSVAASPFKLIVARAMYGPGGGLITGGVASFFATNYETYGDAVKPIIGCVTQPLSAVRGAPRSDLIFDTHRQQPSVSRELSRETTRQVSYTNHCKTGERLLDAIGGVLFDTRRAPSQNELNEITLTTRIADGRAHFVARLGSAVSHNQHVTVQMTDVCGD